jgi:hypothetical protein
MYQTNLHQPWYYPREYVELIEKYNNVCQVVHELSDIIKHLEDKIETIEKAKQSETVKIPKRCRFFNTGFCKRGRACPFKHPEATC